MRIVGKQALAKEAGAGGEGEAVHAMASTYDPITGDRCMGFPLLVKTENKLIQLDPPFTKGRQAASSA